MWIHSPVAGWTNLISGIITTTVTWVVVTGHGWVPTKIVHTVAVVVIFTETYRLLRRIDTGYNLPIKVYADDELIFTDDTHSLLDFDGDDDDDNTQY